MNQKESQHPKQRREKEQKSHLLIIKQISKRSRNPQTHRGQNVGADLGDD